MASPSTPPDSKRPKLMNNSPSTSGDEADVETEQFTADADVVVNPAAPAARRMKRRKVAIFLGYCGFGYQGMQKNPGARTIEGELEEALFLAGAVPAADRGAPRRYDWARAARTDKGVSAAAQVVSGRFYLPEDLLPRLNDLLGPQIRIYGFKRVTNSFNAKKFCDRRRYIYLLPVFALDPSAHPDREAVMASLGSGNELSKCVECSERGRKVPGVMGGREKAEGKPFSSKKAEIPGNVVEMTDSGNESRNLAIEGRNEVPAKTVGDDKMDWNQEFGGAKGPVQKNGDLVHVANLMSGCSGLADGDGNEVESSNLGGGDGAVKSNCVIAVADDINEAGALDLKSENLDIESEVLEEEKHRAEFDGENVDEQGRLCRGFQYSNEVKERFNRILKYYVGTHNFHNFTTRTKPEDPSAKRFIISITADEVVSIDGVDFVKCEVVGQSFMLHQIRKMIGLAVAIARNVVPESVMDQAFRKDVSINVPVAPEVGLFLDECLFSSYNQKWKDSHESISMESYVDEAEEFKRKHIYSHIASMEHKEGAVALWLHSLNLRNYPDFAPKEQPTAVEIANEESK